MKSEKKYIKQSIKSDMTAVNERQLNLGRVLYPVRKIGEDSNLKDTYKRKNFFIGYRMHLILAIAFVSIVALTVLMLTRFYLMRNILYERLNARIDIIGTVLAEHISYSYSLNKNIKNLTSKILSDERANIKFISLVNRNNIVLASSDVKTIGKPNICADSSCLKKEKGDIYIKSFPCNEDSELVSLQMGYSLQKLRKDLNSLLLWSYPMGIAAVVVIIFVAFIISGKLMGPVKEMRIVANMVAEGDFSARVSVCAKDDIGQLGIALNNMAAKLADLTENLNYKIELTVRELARKTRRLEISNRKLMQLDNLKSEFVSMVSHELRTPLTSIIGFARTLLDLNLTEDRKRKYLAIIASEGKRLSHLIDDFLDISKIESGTFELRMKKENINEIIKETTDIIKKPDNIKLELKLGDHIGKVLIDREKMKQVIENILDNAFKYAPEGSSVTIISQKNDNNILVSIRDEGMGIARNNLSKIFDKFFRGENSVSRTSRGSGLGLAIVKGIIEMHKGNIWAESRLGEGSAFIFKIPAIR